MENFDILSKLGEGSYSTVLKVKRHLDNNIYALKKVKLLKLKEKEKINALNEVRILASIKSNFVITYKEAFFDEKESCLGIVMEYADNGDLYQKILEYRKLNKIFEEIEIWKILIQLIKGLKSLHELKILHRDIKSANVFLFKNGNVKLGDLNVSKVMRKGLVYTQTGTPYYASPEVWKDLPYDNKSDIWSLGCVLYEIITLKPPFRANNMENLYKKVIKGIYNKIPDCYSNDLSEIVNLLIQVDCNKRPSCENLLRNPIIMKRIEYFNNFNGDDDNEDNLLLKTINIPKNILFLSANLPKSNYSINNYKAFKSEGNKSDMLPCINGSNNVLNLEKKNSFNVIEKKNENFGIYNNKKIEEYLKKVEEENEKNKNKNKVNDKENLIKENESKNDILNNKNENLKNDDNIKKEIFIRKDDSDNNIYIKKDIKNELSIRNNSYKNELLIRNLYKNDMGIIKENDKEKNYIKLPEIRNNSYDISKRKLIIKKPNFYNNMKSNRNKIALSENDPIYQLYKIYSPKIDKPNLKYGLYNIDRHNVNNNYLKNISKPNNNHFHNIYFSPQLKNPIRNNNYNGQKINLIQKNLLY